MTDIPQNDILLWQQVVSDVQKTNNTNPPLLSKQKQKRLSRKPNDTVPFYKNFNHTPELNGQANIDKRTFLRFKKEIFPPEAVLDLHGLTIDSAYQKVYDFIVSSYNRNKRTILIITGKGLEHKDQDMFAPVGSLKQAVPMWLQSDELKNMILSFIHPSAKLGSEGALYILLRRKRD